MNNDIQIEKHYAHDHLYEAIIEAPGKAGIQPHQVTRKDLSPIDEFHVRGQVPALGLHLLMEPTVMEKLNNCRTNLIERNIVLESGVCENINL